MKNSSTVIILAMHGVPANDIPEREVMELFQLHGQLHRAPSQAQQKLREQHDALDAKIRHWPRNEKNDPYWAASYALAGALEAKIDGRVIVGFNEFCAPTIVEAFDEAVALKPNRIVVVTPMMTAGGEHSEKDIPAAIERAKKKNPDIEIIYAWPFEIEAIAEFLAKQISLHLHR